MESEEGQDLIIIFLLSTLSISSVHSIPANMKSQQKKKEPKKIYLINPAKRQVLEAKACVCRHLSMSEINPISDFGFAHFSIPSCLFEASTTHDGNPQNHSHHSSGQRVNVYLIDGEATLFVRFRTWKRIIDGGSKCRDITSTPELNFWYIFIWHNKFVPINYVGQSRLTVQKRRRRGKGEKSFVIKFFNLILWYQINISNFHSLSLALAFGVSLFMFSAIKKGSSAQAEWKFLCCIVWNTRWDGWASFYWASNNGPSNEKITKNNYRNDIVLGRHKAPQRASEAMYSVHFSRCSTSLSYKNKV